VVAHVDAKAAAEGPSCQAYGQPGPAEGEPAALPVSRTAQGVCSGAWADNLRLLPGGGGGGQKSDVHHPQKSCQQSPAQSSTDFIKGQYAFCMQTCPIVACSRPRQFAHRQYMCFVFHLFRSQPAGVLHSHTRHAWLSLDLTTWSSSSGTELFCRQTSHAPRTTKKKESKC